jgi:hypothetical protein
MQIEDMEIGVVVPSLLYAPIWIAERSGFLADEGLRVRLRSLEQPIALPRRFAMASYLSRWGLRKGPFLMRCAAATLASAVGSSTSRLFR